ncbi:MAG TPA: hypothetical protein PJ982_14740 [Lacipirellulaceae bacterium]|nr:hypothetical protein [Lacipirellulaceae bacterium]
MAAIITLNPGKCIQIAGVPVCAVDEPATLVIGTTDDCGLIEGPEQVLAAAALAERAGRRCKVHHVAAGAWLRIGSRQVRVVDTTLDGYVIEERPCGQRGRRRGEG